jgi:hypothetical protein
VPELPARHRPAGHRQQRATLFEEGSAAPIPWRTRNAPCALNAPSRIGRRRKSKHYAGCCATRRWHRWIGRCRIMPVHYRRKPPEGGTDRRTGCTRGIRFALPILLPGHHQAHAGACELTPALPNPARCVGAAPLSRRDPTQDRSAVAHPCAWLSARGPLTGVPSDLAVSSPSRPLPKAPDRTPEHGRRNRR